MPGSLRFLPPAVSLILATLLAAAAVAVAIMLTTHGHTAGTGAYVYNGARPAYVYNG